MPVSAETRFCLMRALVPSSSWLKRTSFGDTAENSFTGTFTSPKLMAPLQIARGMFLFSHWLRRLPHDVTCRLVLAQPLERRVAQHAVVGPFGELDLGDELWFDPDCARNARRAHERRRVTAQRLEAAQQIVERLAGEAGADVAGVDQAVALVVAQQQRAEMVRPVARARAPSTDDELLAALVLDLEPGARPAPGLVRAVEPLGDDALELLGLGGGEHDVAVPDVVAGRLPPRSRELERLETG